ncbi:TonB family protein [Bacteroides sp. GD17]|jgi:TonB family protein|uniref:TonB family protein n=1 Tax=Bacteroides sp. GD17 TaxID=3139826 RepID=UPI0025FCF239|nr:TonB family protein [uncultured Bacteroides sp.]
MGLFFVYILKSSICLAVFYLFYRLLMARETFHRFNRFALLGILLLSCLLPLIEVSVKQHSEVTQTMLTLEQLLMMADAMSSVGPEVQVQDSTSVWIKVALLVYLAGIFFFALRNVYSLTRLLMLLKSGRRERIATYLPDKGKRVTLIVHNRDIAPFSWMKYIVISRKDLEENGREILIHELAHIHNRHSWDLLVADICIFFQWFNPASWLLKQELQNIHEFEADETVIKEGVDAKQYQLLLIKKAVGTRLYSMANSFNHSKLKKRITMMLKEKSSPWARLKYLYVLPVAAIAVTAFARPEISEKVEEISVVKVNDLSAIVETKATESVEKALEMPAVKALPGDTTKPAGVQYVPVPVDEQSNGGAVFEVVEKMPEFPGGGVTAMMDYLQKNMQYPESAKKAGTQGRVTVRFVVDKDGSIKNPSVLRSVDKDMDAEALRLVKSMPKWQPGMQGGKAVAVKYTIPVVFKLEGGTFVNSKLNGNVVSIDVDAGNLPLYVVDGLEASPSIMGALDPSRIEGITVLKDKSATDLYGEKGKNGVLLITLKKGNLPTVKIDKNTTGISGIGGVYDGGKKLDMSDVTIYIDGAEVISGRPIDEVIPADKIDNVRIDKDASGKGAIYITTKKGKGVEKTSAQGNMKVEGRVQDKQGEPVVGASVLIEGTNMGTISDVDGRFVLSVPDKNAVLLISYIDMETAKVKAKSKLVVTLKSE